MRPKAVLRDAEVRDLPALATLAAESYRTAFAEILDEAAFAQRDQAFFLDYFATALPWMRVAEVGEAIAAFSRLTGAHLDMLFTDRRFQGHGHGAALLADAEARGARTLEAFAANLPARRFYEARGWRKTREYEREFVGQVRAFVYYEK